MPTVNQKYVLQTYYTANRTKLCFCTRMFTSKESTYRSVTFVKAHTVDFPKRQQHMYRLSDGTLVNLNSCYIRIEMISRNPRDQAHRTKHIKPSTSNRMTLYVLLINKHIQLCNASVFTNVKGSRSTYKN